MIKINLLAEKKQTRAKSGAGAKTDAAGLGRNLVLVGVLVLGAAVVGVWWWMLSDQIADWRRQHEEADAELVRLESIRKKGEEYKTQKELLARKIELITALKKKQEVPVHILDQVSKSLPDFLWLESMSASSNQVTISGRATTYNAVSNFYSNLNQSGYFKDVALGRTFEVPEGVSFSLTCEYAQPGQGPSPAAAPPTTQG
jgi:type IV pilus assembly protein PilN